MKGMLAVETGEHQTETKLWVAASTIPVGDTRSTLPPMTLMKLDARRAGGAPVGGACLEADSFLKIVRAGA